jgi:protease I
MTKKALILTWSGFQDQEVIYPYYRLLGAGFEVECVADSRDGAGRVYGILGAHVPCTMLMEDFLNNASRALSSFDLLVIPGGVKALEKIRLEAGVVDFVKSWNEAGKIIASTCHGAQLLISAKATKGRVIAGYYSIEDDIVNSGAEYSREPVVVDGNVVSSPHYDHMGPWMETAINMAGEPRSSN